MEVLFGSLFLPPPCYFTLKHLDGESVSSMNPAPALNWTVNILKSTRRQRDSTLKLLSQYTVKSKIKTNPTPWDAWGMPPQAPH